MVIHWTLITSWTQCSKRHASRRCFLERLTIRSLCVVFYKCRIWKGCGRSFFKIFFTIGLPSQCSYTCFPSPKDIFSWTKSNSYMLAGKSQRLLPFVTKFTILTSSRWWEKDERTPNPMVIFCFGSRSILVWLGHETQEQVSCKNDFLVQQEIKECCE